MNPLPLISIVIPYYNSSHYFRDLLESIAFQTIKDIEIIIIDDKSKKTAQKKLKEIVALFPDLPITVVMHAKNQGVAATRNEGIDMAKGKYITFIDADDMLCGKYSLEYRMHFLERNQEVSGIAGYPIMIDDKSKFLFNLSDKKIPFFQKAVHHPEKLLKIYCENILENSMESASTLFFLTGSSLLRKKDVIYFDSAFDLEDDVEWIIRYLKEKSIKLEMIPFHYRRVHNKQYHLVTPSKITKKVIDLAKDALK